MDLEVGSVESAKSPLPTSKYPGQGTQEDPVVVSFKPGADGEDPRAWSPGRKWTLTIASNISLLCISVSPTIYSSGIEQLSTAYGVGIEVATLGVSVYQLAFAFGPLYWAPLSEMYGPVFSVSFSIFTLFTLGTALAKNTAAMLVCRFLAGATGSSVLVTSAAIIGDLFDASDRGPSMSLYLIAAFGGPIIGPLSGSFLAAATSDTWIFWLLTIFAGVSFCAGAVASETYAPVRMRRLAANLTESTGLVHRSALEPVTRVPVSAALKVSLVRPFQMLFREGDSGVLRGVFGLHLRPALRVLWRVSLVSTLPASSNPAQSLTSSACRIYHGERGWSTGIASLPFIAVGIGMLGAVVLNL
ncbi:hypothetical protein QFC20_006695 [Naganishia adeliensis]|uniref:Uncharacterized protein n=1 Tax=Naganishia adeliensis TaxID=92952 RepID=A0ACC2V7V8_9TREE|nr:hypothetical protein QFC20_006695 [Naganishia adeliensis]